MLDKKPKRFRGQPTKPAPTEYVHGLHHVSNKNIVFGSESNSHYVDVVSVGPIGGIKQVYLDETSFETGEFPKSTIYIHDGDGPQNPWDGDFPFVERTIAVGKSAEIVEAGTDEYSRTEFTRRVVSLGVVGLRVNFTTSGFTQKDDNNDEKEAKARFTVSVLSPEGDVVAFRSSDYTYFSARNPTAVQVNITPPSGYESTHWEYKVLMEVRGYAYRINASGNWSASTVTEIYKDTQTYDKIAYASGTIVASDVSGSIPMRQYLTDGYKVQVPIYQTIGGNQVMTGEFTRRTSDSPAWNAMAVLTDEVWGAGLPLDKIDIVSFEEFDKYCTRELVNNSQRYLFSHYLIKSDNYYKLASEMVGSADGKLYEDTSGRIGVLIDKQSDNRRVITSYDIVNENVKRTTVTDNKRTNYVEVEFADRENLYKKTIINEVDQGSIDKNGVVSSKLKLDTCTRLSEAEMVAKKILATSQYSTSSYAFKVGNTHEDIQIGEIVELYDRKYSNVNYCGKVASGSTTTEIVIDPRTPINLDGIKTPLFTVDNARGVPIRVPITSWTSLSIVLSTPLPATPRDFTSFGIYDADDTGTKPTLIRILGVDDSSGTMALEGIEYNDSLQDYVEIGSPLVIHNYRYIPEQQIQDITGLVIIKNLGGITASWDFIVGGYEFAYIWKVTPIGETASTVIKQGIATTNSTFLPNPLVEGTYQVQVAPVLNGEQVGDFSVATIGVAASAGSALPAPTGLSVLLDDGSSSTEYSSNFFKLQWEQVDQVGETTVSHFKLKLSQNGLSKEIIIDGAERSYSFSNTSLTEYFGDYTRQFAVELLAVDSGVHSTALSTITINNPAPPAPMLTLDNTGSITLSYSPSIPDDVIGSRTVLWAGTNTNASAPIDAKVILSSNATNISIPEGYVALDGTSYVFDVSWVDGFGESTFHTKELFSFDPDIIVPTPPVLTSVTPIDSQTVLVNFTHDGTYLKKMKISYNRVGTDVWVELAEVFNIPPTGSNNGYDVLEGSGFIRVAGLVRNFEYNFKAVTSNTSSLYSDDSNIITGSPYLDVTTGGDLSDLTDLVGSVGDDLNLKLATETINRKETDKALFDTAASAVQLRKDIDNGMSGVTDAIFEVDPATGQIRNRAFAYTDESFSQANLLIDGVNAEVLIQAARITDAGDRITSAESTITLQAGQIELKASYTEVNGIVAGAIDAVLPVYSFGFFNSVEGWSAVNGTLASATSKINLVYGDITNQSLSYSADENPVITLQIERTAGTGWQGDLIVTFSGGSTQTYAGVIDDVDAGVGSTARVLNLGGETTYTGTVTGIRIRLGQSNSDTFTVTSITIGKPSATLEALDGITAQVNQLGIDLDAVEGSLTNYVTTTFYGENSVTFNNLDVTLDGSDAIISLKATQQELDENDVVTKANSAAIWIDASESNITQVVTSYNAQPDGVDDQIQDLNDQYNLVQSEIDASLGLIRDQSVSINRLGNKDKNVEKNAFYAATQLLKQRDGILEVGEAVATADRQLQAITDDVSALSQEVVELTASFGSDLGQIDAKFLSVNQAIVTETQARVVAISELTASIGSNTASIVNAQQAIVDETDARVSSISQLTTSIGEDIAIVDQAAKAAIGYCMIGGSPSSHETKTLCESVGGTWISSTLATATRTVQVSSGGNTATVGDFYESYIDLEGNVSGKAVIGVDVNGTWTGMSVVGGNSYSKITFKGNAVEFQTATGSPALYWNSTDNTWVFNGRLVVGGYQVDDESDIRGLDGADGAGAFTLEIISNAVATPSSLSKVGGLNAWDSGAYSKERYAAAAATSSFASAGYYMFGLTNTFGVGNEDMITYAIYNVDGAIRIRDGGVSRGNFGPILSTDIFSVVNDGSTVRYLKNGNVIYTSTILPSGPYGYQAALHTPHSLLNNISFTSSGFTGADGTDGVDGADGTDGQIGAGFFGSTYTTIDWTTATANSRFTSLVGRPPVNLDIFTQTRTDGNDSQARQYNGSSWVGVALQVNGTIVAKGTVAGDRLVAGTEISGPIITGGLLRTAAGTATRTEIQDDGTYLIWSGTGTKTDANGKFWIKKDGTGFVSGSFFSGQIIETNLGSGTTLASVSHKSAGNTVEVTFNSNGFKSVTTASPPSPVGSSTYVRTYTIKRGTTVIDSGSVVVNRIVSYNAEGGGTYDTSDSYSFSTVVLDSGTASATYTYTAEIQALLLSSPIQRTTIKTFEDLLN